MRFSIFSALALALLALVSTGCGPAGSLHPYWEENESVTAAGLAGTWHALDGNKDFERVRFEPGADGSITMTLAGKENHLVLNGYSRQEENLWYLDLVPARLEIERNVQTLNISFGPEAGPRSEEISMGCYLMFDRKRDAGPAKEDSWQCQLVAAHLLVRIQLEGGQLSLSYLDQSWLKKVLESNSIPGLTVSAGDPLLLSPTAVLGQLVRTAGEDPEAFEEAMIFRAGNGK